MATHSPSLAAGLPVDRKVRTDQMLLITRLLHVVLAVVVLPFFIGLTFYPEHTDQNFAWPLKPRMSAMLFGSLYLAVVFSFSRAATVARWHEFAMVMWATLPVLALLGVVTLMHFDKFTKGTAPFYVWFVVYVCFPPFLAGLLYWNRLQDPFVLEPGDVRIPLWIRWTTTGLGVLFLGIGTALFFFPANMESCWPWKITPLSSRGIACLFLAPATTHFIALTEPRWSALRLVTQAAIVWFAAISVAVFRCWDEFQKERVGTWVFLVMLGLEFAFALLSYLSLEAQRKALATRGGR